MKWMVSEQAKGLRPFDIASAGPPRNVDFKLRQAKLGLESCCPKCYDQLYPLPASAIRSRGFDPSDELAAINWSVVEFPENFRAYFVAEVQEKGIHCNGRRKVHGSM